MARVARCGCPCHLRYNSSLDNLALHARHRSNVKRVLKMKHCNECNLDFPDANRMCSNCGGTLADAAAAVGAAGKCPSCGADAQPGWKFCIVCSREIPQTAVEVVSTAAAGLNCQRCGNNNAVGLKFCIRCGNQLVAQASNQTQTLGSQNTRPGEGPPAQGTFGSPLPPPPHAWSAAAPCRNCGTAVPAGRTHCAVCGTPVAFYQPGPQVRAKKTPWVWIILGVAALVLIVIGASLFTYLTLRAPMQDTSAVPPPPPPRVSTTPSTPTTNLAGLRVKVIYVPRRSVDANRAAARLRERGMDVVMLEITDSGNGPHLGRVYSVKPYEQQARKIAELVSDIEPVQFYEQEAKFDVGQQFNLWIAK